MRRFILKEQVGPRRIATSAVAFLGTVLVIQPYFTRFGTTALFAIGSALCFALYKLVIRHLSRDQHRVKMQLNTLWRRAFFACPFLAFGSFAKIGTIRFVLPDRVVWWSCLSVGFAAPVSHLAMNSALSLAPSSTLVPLGYLEIVTATLFGSSFFGDFAIGITWTGDAIIVRAGLYDIPRECVVSRASG